MTFRTPTTVLGVLVSLAQTALSLPPESPAIWREVTGVINDHSSGNPVPKFTRPHMPGFRTSADGRVALICEAGGAEGGLPRFVLMMPEKMSQPFLLNPPGSHTMSSTSFKWLDGYATASASRLQFTDGVKYPSHACLWETAPPTVVNNEDVYTLKVVVTANHTNASNQKRTQVFATPIKVFVTNPKTQNAYIRSIVLDGPTVAGPVYPFVASAFEPVVVGDGRLLVLRVNSPGMPWTDPVTNVTHPSQGIDIAYSYYSTGDPADPTLWTDMLPISHAPYDSRINNKFGFAKAPFRDSEGNVIPDGEDLGGSYPWMDREARMLFFEAVGDQLHYQSGGVWDQSRYPHRGTPEEPIFYGPEFGGKHQGVTMLGLWTHGKMVQIDNLNNDMDYAVASANPNPVGNNPEGSQREVQLFQANSGPYQNESGWLRLGMGRATKNMPVGENDNGNIIDSLEQIFNYRKDFVPISFGDVVWPLTNGKQTDEVVFDDYLDPDAFIIATMAGHLSFDLAGAQNATSNNYNYLIHHSGWNNSTKTFDQPVKLQNAATAPADRWIVPEYGLVTGGGRLEPAATGGIRGKGFWQDGTTGLRFVVPAQNAGVNVSAFNWYAGLFVDCRFADDDTIRRLITFPDGTSISLLGRHQVIYADSSGLICNRISLPTENTASPQGPMDEAMPDSGWAHLAFQIRKAGTDVTMHLNGLPYNHWADPYVSLFQMTPGNLTLGRPSGQITSFRGWMDDFKVFAHEVDLETCCNHAGGTLIGLESSYSGIWKTKVADRYPDWSHAHISSVLKSYGESTYPRYACYRDYTQDHAVHLGNVPANTVSLRTSIQFPEGPIFYNRPRPHSVANQFCLTCHHVDGEGGLDIDALELVSTINAANDNRRQPMQPNKRIYGRIPAQLIQPRNVPGSAVNLGTNGKLIDQWMLDPFDNQAQVVSFSVVDPDSGKELMELENGSVVDPARLGQNNLTLRANLDRAQGDVVMQYDSQSANTRSEPPYCVFGTSSNPLAGAVLSAGSHTLTANPQFGSSQSINFTVPQNTARVIADYRDDFQTHSPASPWMFAWNSGGDVANPANYDQLSWSPAKNRYTSTGTDVFPAPFADGAYVSLTSTGGHPGRGTDQGHTFDRYALVGFNIKYDGYYAVANSYVRIGNTNSNGGRLRLYKDINGGANFVLMKDDSFPPGSNFVFNRNVGFLESGDTLWVAIGPNDKDSSDGFTLDFSISYQENGNPY